MRNMIASRLAKIKFGGSTMNRYINDEMNER